MCKTLFLLTLTSLFFTGAFAQETKIENTQLQLNGDNLIITYDVIGSTDLDNVWLDIKTTSNKTITAKTLSGDIGKTILVGKNKKIIWDMKADGIDLQGEELNVKVLAKEPNNEDNTYTEIVEIVRGRQSKNRDKIIFKNGNKLTGKLDQRFTRNNFRFISSDGNILTLKQDEIEKIKYNGLTNHTDSIYLKNGDIIWGEIEEIYPNDKIILKSSKNSNKYYIQFTNIRCIITTFNWYDGI
jgi:hypothetical protein